MISFLVEAIKRNAWLKLLAAGFTILLYLAAKTPSTQPVERDLSVRPILTGIRTGLASPMLLPEVVIHLRGSERVIVDLKSSLRVEADGRRAEQGRNRIPLIVTLPPELTNEITIDAPPSLVIFLSRSAKKKLPIQSVDTSDIVEYMFIEGASELVDKSVSIRRSALSVQGGNQVFEVLDSDGEVVEPLNVIPVPNPTKATVGLQTKSLVVSCELTGDAPPNVVITGYRVTPSSIIVRGTNEALAVLQNIPLEIPLTTISKSTTLRKQVRLPNGISGNATPLPIVDVTVYVRER